MSVILAVRRLGQEVLKLLAGLGCRVRETLSLKTEEAATGGGRPERRRWKKSWHICNMLFLAYERSKFPSCPLCMI